MREARRLVLLLVLVVAHRVASQEDEEKPALQPSSLDTGRYVVTQDRLTPSHVPTVSRTSLRSRFSALSPAELLQRASSTRSSVPSPQGARSQEQLRGFAFQPRDVPISPDIYQDSAENEDVSVPQSKPFSMQETRPDEDVQSFSSLKQEKPSQMYPTVPIETPAENYPAFKQQSDIVSTTAPPVTNRSYRKQYSNGRRQQQNDSGNLKELLKQAGTLSLSEVLQQRNLSLSDLLQGKKLALSILKSNDSPSSTTEKSATVSMRSSTLHRIYEATERTYTTTKRPVRESAIFNTGQRSQFLQNKRVIAAPPSSSQDDSQRWPTIPAPRNHGGDDDTRKKGDSREDILELLQPGSPVSLAHLLSSRNMTLAELMEHRERGSKQQPLADLFGEIFHNATKSTPVVNIETIPSRSQNHVHSVILSTVKPRGSRDPRLLDLPRRPTYPPDEEQQQGEEEEEDREALNTHVKVDHYDYEEEDDEDGQSAMPTAVKSAILASGGLLALTLVLFAAIFLCCKIQQRKRRGSRAPFLRGSRLSKSERSVVIKPAENKAHNDLLEF